MARIGLLGYQVTDFNISSGDISNSPPTYIKRRKMSDIEIFNFSFKNKNIIIKVQRHSRNDEIIYVAKSSFRNITAVGECWETALEKCIKRIKFAFLRLEKKINLLKENEARAIVKEHFRFELDDLYRRYGDRLSDSVFVEDELMTFNMLVSEKNEPTNKAMPSAAIVYVNLITGECEMVMNCKEL